MTRAKPRGLGVELRRLRKAAGLSQPELAERCGWSHSTISRIETGAKLPTMTELATILAVFGVVGEARDHLLHLTTNPEQRGWWEIGNPGLPQQLTALMEFEREATRITDISLVLIPGLLQTAEYARAIIAASQHDDDPEPLVAVRLGRQGVLTRHRPVEFRALIDESALLRPVGGPAAMAEQLRHLGRMVARPNITVQIMPVSLGAHFALNGNHRIIEFADAPTIVYLEHLAAGLFLDEPEDVSLYVRAVPPLHKNAMSTDESSRFIAQCAEEMEAQCRSVRPS